jgi:hypothetical protein
METAEQTARDAQERLVAARRIKRRRDFLWHLVTYLVINGLMVFVWAIGPRATFWPVWLMVFWGIGLAFHAYYALGRQEVTEVDVDAELRRSARRGGKPEG